MLHRNALIMNNRQEKTLLPSEVKRELKRLAHHLKPVVLAGKKGITPEIIKEIDIALCAHELIKLQISPKIKESLADDLQEIVRETNAEHIDTIGNIVILFRKNKENSQFEF